MTFYLSLSITIPQVQLGWRWENTESQVPGIKWWRRRAKATHQCKLTCQRKLYKRQISLTVHLQDWCVEHSSCRIRCTLSPYQEQLLPYSIQLERTFAQGWARMSCVLGRGRRRLRIHGVTTKSFMPFHCCWLNNNLRRGCLQSSACRRG